MSDSVARGRWHGSKDAPAQPEKLHVLLSEPGSSGDPEATANAALLEAGLARLQRPPPRIAVAYLGLPTPQPCSVLLCRMYVSRVH